MALYRDVAGVSSHDMLRYIYIELNTFPSCIFVVSGIL